MFSCLPGRSILPLNRYAAGSSCLHQSRGFLWQPLCAPACLWSQCISRRHRRAQPGHGDSQLVRIRAHSPCSKLPNITQRPVRSQPICFGFFNPPSSHVLSLNYYDTVISRNTYRRIPLSLEHLWTSQSHSGLLNLAYDPLTYASMSYRVLDILLQPIYPQFRRKYPSSSSARFAVLSFCYLSRIPLCYVLVPLTLYSK